MPPPLILASASPRRRQLLASLGLAFTVDSAGIDESALPAEAPEPHARRLAATKAQVVASRHPDAVVLAADTIVVQAGAILGKPADAVDARRMLAALRDAPHQVVSAVAVSGANGLVSASHTSQVIMRPYTDAEIETYLASDDPYDKAGAYAIQHPEFQPVARFDGCFASIMGLPLALVVDLLAAAGQAAAPDWPTACAALTGACCQGTFDRSTV